MARRTKQQIDNRNLTECTALVKYGRVLKKTTSRKEHNKIVKCISHLRTLGLMYNSGTNIVL